MHVPYSACSESYKDPQLSGTQSLFLCERLFVNEAAETKLRSFSSRARLFVLQKLAWQKLPQKQMVVVKTCSVGNRAGVSLFHKFRAVLRNLRRARILGMRMHTKYTPIRA